VPSSGLATICSLKNTAPGCSESPVKQGPPTEQSTEASSLLGQEQSCWGPLVLDTPSTARSLHAGCQEGSAAISPRLQALEDTKGFAAPAQPTLHSNPKASGRHSWQNSASNMGPEKPISLHSCALKTKENRY